MCAWCVYVAWLIIMYEYTDCMFSYAILYQLVQEGFTNKVEFEILGKKEPNNSRERLFEAEKFRFAPGRAKQQV